MEHQFDAFSWDSVANQLLSSPCDRSRGNLAKHRGYTAVDFKTKPGKPVTFPSFLKSTNQESVEQMVQATGILKDFYRYFGAAIPFNDNLSRTKQFSSFLCQSFGLPMKDNAGHPLNLFEFCTDAATVIPDPGKTITLGGLKYRTPTQVKCHIDSINCPVWSAAFIMHNHIPIEGG